MHICELLRAEALLTRAWHRETPQDNLLLSAVILTNTIVSHRLHSKIYAFSIRYIGQDLQGSQKSPPSAESPEPHESQESPEIIVSEIALTDIIFNEDTSADVVEGEKKTEKTKCTTLGNDAAWGMMLQCKAVSLELKIFCIHSQQFCCALITA